MSKRFKKLAALVGVPVICPHDGRHDGGRHTGNALMPDAGRSSSTSKGSTTTAGATAPSGGPAR